jgi:hypothetical protein
VPPGGVGPRWLTSPSPSDYFHLPAKYEFMGIFLELLVFRNMVSCGPFSSRSMALAVNSPIIIKHVKIEETT